MATCKATYHHSANTQLAAATCEVAEKKCCWKRICMTFSNPSCLMSRRTSSRVRVLLSNVKTLEKCESHVMNSLDITYLLLLTSDLFTICDRCST